MQNSGSIQDHTNPPKNRWRWFLTSEITYFLLFGGGIIGFFLGQITSWMPSPYHQQIAMQPSPAVSVVLSQASQPTTFVSKTYYHVPLSDPTQTAKWTTYTNVKFGYSFKYLASHLYPKDLPCHTLVDYCPTNIIYFEIADRPTHTPGSNMMFAHEVDIMFAVVDIKSGDQWPNGNENLLNLIDENIIIGGKTGRVVSGDNKLDPNIAVRNIDIPLKGTEHLRIQYSSNIVPLDEFNQILSTFKFTD